MPKLSPTMTEGKLVRWLKQEGDLVKEGDALCEIGTDKSTMEFTSIESGYIRKIYYREGSVVPLGKILVILSSDPNEEIPAEKEEAAPVTEEGKKEEERPAAQTATMTTLPTFAPAPPRQGYHFEERGEVRASPLAKKIAKEKKVCFFIANIFFCKTSTVDGWTCGKDRKRNGYKTGKCQDAGSNH